MADFSTKLLSGRSYAKCTACSDAIIDGYQVGGVCTAYVSGRVQTDRTHSLQRREHSLGRWQAGGIGFCMRAFNEPSFLEDVTGLTQMLAVCFAILRRHGSPYSSTPA
jgi:hypothetical protein